MFLAVDWTTPPRRLECAADEVHIWRVHLDVPASRIEALAATLNAEELDRAARFYAPLDRHRYIAAHAIQRNILGRYLGEEPACVRLGRHRFGKPFLAAGTEGSLRFNMSHAEALGLYAATSACDIGIDVERVLLPSRSIVAPTPPMEREGSDPREAILTWVRREAYLKAIGAGLHGLDREIADQRSWNTATFEPCPGHIAAVTVERWPVRFRAWEWQDAPS
jgi:4'-phosphopantetheinyl transferase